MNRRDFIKSSMVGAAALPVLANQVQGAARPVGDMYLYSRMRVEPWAFNLANIGQEFDVMKEDFIRSTLRKYQQDDWSFPDADTKVKREYVGGNHVKQMERAPIFQGPQQPYERRIRRYFQPVVGGWIEVNGDVWYTISNLRKDIGLGATFFLYGYLSWTPQQWAMTRENLAKMWDYYNPQLVAGTVKKLKELG